MNKTVWNNKKVKLKGNRKQKQSKETKRGKNTTIQILNIAG